MSKKRLNTETVLNELSGQSIFFQEPAQTERNTVRKSVRSEKRTVELPVRRATKRYSFEFYDDQITRLRKIKIDTELHGKSIFLSEIVREALDEYFENHDTERSENRTEIRTNGNTVDIPHGKTNAK